MTPAVKSRGIIFRGDMVRAILAGAKTQTRRIVKPTAKGCTVGAYTTYGRSDVDIEDLFNVDEDGDPADASRFRCPYGVPGDELWVREMFGVVRSLGADRDHDSDEYVYRADPASAYQWDASETRSDFRWRPSIFMPREASRLTLVVESVRVERLSAITEGDAEAEGFEASGTPFQVQQPNGSWEEDLLVVTARDQYLRAFRAMHKLAADADPWLWVIGFRKQGGAS